MLLDDSKPSFVQRAVKRRRPGSSDQGKHSSCPDLVRALVAFARRAGRCSYSAASAVPHGRCGSMVAFRASARRTRWLLRWSHGRLIPRAGGPFRTAVPR